MTLLAINTSTSATQSIELPLMAERYTLSAEKLESSRVQLNGRELKLGVHDELPAFEGQHIAAGPVELAPASITFLAIEGADNRNCR